MVGMDKIIHTVFHGAQEFQRVPFETHIRYTHQHDSGDQAQDKIMEIQDRADERDCKYSGAGHQTPAGNIKRILLGRGIEADVRILHVAD